MTKLTRQDINCETGIESIVELSADELELFNKHKLEEAKRQADLLEIEAKKQEVLAKLGLTADEVFALLA